MSYARFSDSSDVYIFEHSAGFIQCCGCNLTEPTTGEYVGFADLATPRLALQHLEAHIEAGDKVPQVAIDRIKEEFPDLDVEIPPYTPDPAAQARVREAMRIAYEFGEQPLGD